MEYKYRHVVVGGTFDRFHIGHQALINKAFELSQQISIGLTCKNLYQRKLLFASIEDYQTREKKIVDYLQNNNWINRCKIIPLTDVYGTTIIDSSIEAVFVTEETHNNALKANEERKRNGFRPMEVIVVPFVNADDGGKVTSERIRIGEIDRTGVSYLHFLFLKDKWILPEEMRSKLKEMLGVGIRGVEDKLSDATAIVIDMIRKTKPMMVISVGDCVTMALIEGRIEPDVSIIDLKTKRQTIDKSQLQLYIKNDAVRAVNHPGTINLEAVRIYKEAINGHISNRFKKQILIEGEEDLLALPAILLAPLGSVVLYGQPDYGIVMVEVSETKKAEVKKLLERFV